ncbi:MAG: hypothetical protein IPP84_14780 [Propionivibrio sp.]|uniref:hypothetical protein n=1 Tax=Propionivibrio sp. TaxID=2212460 RepID=UPI0025DF88F0|nr:hypothetical protein [Propionivibrio sp.]MBL0209147.1 hypothetical protein [Propionivibrio sp.]
MTKGLPMKRTFLLVLCLLTLSTFTVAQTVEQLPVSPAYKGEIRRGVDGKLIILEGTSEAKASADESRRPATMRVGSQERITSISEAAKLARDGEIIEIQPGTYRGQPAVWTQNNLVIRGAGERPVMLADGKSAEGKAIWVIKRGNVRIENIQFRGARVGSGNGAGIRLEHGHLVVTRCAFIDNEMGILTSNIADMTLEVSDSEFAAAPHDMADLHHLLYVGAIRKFILSGSRFEQGYKGHLVKSRARENMVRNNMLVDGQAGRSSYELEFPNGGIAYVLGNVIGQSAGTDNPEIVSYGAEGPRWPDNRLVFAHNTLINDLHTGTFLKLWDEKFPGGIESWVINNLTVGYGELYPPAHGRFEGNKSVPRRDLLEYGGLPLRLNSASPLRGSVRIPGQAFGVDLMPATEFTFPIGTRLIHPSNSLAPGAFQ